MAELKIGTPNAKQRAAMLDKHRHIAYGGARGGGKSWFIRVKAILMCLKYPGIKIKIIRRTFPELLENHIEPICEMLKVGTDKALATYNVSNKLLRFPNGSKIRFGYCNNDNDVRIYQGMESDIVFIEEATQLPEDWIKAIAASVRGTNSFPKRVYYTCNPGGIGHAYIKRLFVDRQFLDNEHPEDYSFIQALVYDNDVLMKSDPDYLRMLESQPEARRKAWMDGSWDVYEGQAFPEFRNQPDHYQDRKWTHVIEGFPIPQTWKVYRGFDYGYTKPFAVGWWAIDHDGRTYKFKEWYGCTKQPNTGLQITPQEIAAGIKEREETDPQLKGRIIYGIADPAIWQATTGESIAEMMERAGVYFGKGDHTRLAGKMQMHYRLAFDEDGFPMAYIFKDCKETIRTLPLLIYDEKHTEDIDTDGEDHIYDSDRYVLMEHPLNPRRTIKRYTASDPLPPEDPLEIIEESKYGRD